MDALLGMLAPDVVLHGDGGGKANPKAQGKAKGPAKAPAAKANPADTAYRANLRNCVQQTGEQRETCLDQAIEKHERA